MAERFFDMWRVDVFTEIPLAGNPLAVFPRATGLSKEEMEAITREMNLSETTFVFPASSPAAHYRNRIFTPGGEIPFAGHPSLGTAYVAALEGLVPTPEGASVIYQELEIGVLPLELHVDGGQVQKVVMTQGEPSLGKRFTAIQTLAKALGVRTRDVGAGKLKPQVASTGIPSLQVPMRSLDVVRGLDPDMKSLSKILAKVGAHTVCYAFALEAEGKDAQVHARSFSPLDGIREDPATGSAAGACGAYLAANGRLPAPDFVIEQGFEMRHPSRIEVTVEVEGQRVKSVRVGGRVTPILRGSLRLP
ncbi:MAG: PhzF family phenazine biosynthesis protein [Candidatus Thermoplasmatota archaeon]